MVAYANATQLLPDGLQYVQAAPIFCAGYTVYSGLRIAEPKTHERVAIEVRVMTESFPLDDMNTAYDKVVKGELRFRAVLKIQ